MRWPLVDLPLIQNTRSWAASEALRVLNFAGGLT
jgi:hypothetical protein